MRLQYLNTNYQAYWKSFYKQHSTLGASTYADQLATLETDSFGNAYNWLDALARLGYETDIIVANIDPLQKQWALEHDFSYGSDWMRDIVAAQIRRFQPDILFVGDYAAFGTSFLRQLRQDTSSIRLIVGWCGAPYWDASVFHEYDVVLSNVPELVADFRAQGHTVYHVNHSFAPQILDRIQLHTTPSVDFSFIGSIVKNKDFHGEREQLLIKLAKHTDIQIFSEAQGTPRREFLGTRARQLAYDVTQHIPTPMANQLPVIRRVARWPKRPQLSSRYVDSRLESHLRPPIFGLAMYQKLHDSRVTLNTHIDISAHSASNMRLYEATGVGTCLLTDWKDNLSELFEPDREVVTYRSPEEAIEKVRYLLDHDDERRAIAQAGQRRTLREHTTSHQIAQMDSIFRSHLYK